MNKKRQNIFVISGPSGSGKSTLIERLFKKYNSLNFSISHTTRPMRGKEADGVDYHFISVEEFELMIKKNEFVEWAEVYGNYYGTSKEEIRKKSAENNILILDIDIQGAKKIKEVFDDAVLTLISPPSFSVLEDRLIKRENRNDGDIKKRLSIALSELKEYDYYDYIIINDELENAFDRLENIFLAYKNSKQFIENDLIKILKAWEKA